MGFLTGDSGVSTYDPATGEFTGVITDYIQFAADCLGNQELEFQLVGYDSKDDAAVYRITDDLALVQTVDVQLYDYDGNPVENSNIRTNTSLIQAKVPVLTTREVELAVEFSGVPGAAMNSIKCDITPKTVRLNGEADVLDSIDKLVLATLHVDDLELHQQNSYVVTPPDGTWLANSNEVATVEITMEITRVRSTLIPASRATSIS